MKNFKRVFIDLSSIVWTNLLAGVDPEHMLVMFNDKEVKVNTWQYGYENAINNLVKMMRDTGTVPSQLVFAKEGMQSKFRRCAIDPNYKASRDSRPPEAYEQFGLLRDELCKVFRNLGSIVVTQDYVEGDDIIAYLCKHTEDDAVVVTNDKDLLVLVGQNEYGADVQVRCNGEIGPNPFGGFDFKLIRLYKALVGDTSDNIKGVKGFGEKAWGSLNLTYDDDGCFELMNLLERGDRNGLDQIIQGNAGDGGRCKLLDKILENWDDAARCLKLVTLRPEWVNTVKHQLVWEPGMVGLYGKCADERLAQWGPQARLVSLENYNKALEFFKSKLDESPFVSFDIETSTPEESDDWLLAQDKPDGVDVIGSYLVGFSLTFGRNHQYTYYVSVKHKAVEGCTNISMVQAREMIEAMFGKEIIIQNTNFELVVLYQAQDEDGNLWRDHWAKYGQSGFMPGVLDTKIEANYVDENEKSGLKDRSLMHLGYEQESFKEVTTIEGVQHKMHQLTAKHVFSYGADDAITTAALHGFYKFVMQIEHAYKVYLQVEISPLYLHAKQFVDGFRFDIGHMKALEKEDDATFSAAWATVRDYLITRGWEGTVPPTYTQDITAKQIKEAYAIVQGLAVAEESDEEDEEGAEVEPINDPILKTRVRTPAKLVALLKAEGHTTFAALLEGCLAGQAEAFTTYVRSFFTGEPVFKSSNKQLSRLLYETMQLPVRVRNKPTAKMKAEGHKVGTPKGDALAMAYALRDADEVQAPVLEALKLMQMVKTRKSLYYSKYPYFLHWKTGKIHSSHNQCATNTRRASSSGPNMQQLPKNAKIEGQPAKFRECILPHKKDAVVVSMDFMAQEMRVIADYSKDKNLVACYVGDNKKDMHALTGLGILMRKEPAAGWTYEKFVEVLNEPDHEDFKKVKKFRGLGKQVNFTTEFGAQAPKLASVLLVDEEEAQTYLDAREDSFPEVKQWKLDVQAEAKQTGFVRTKMGAVRHLAKALNSEDRFIASKADRQAVNFMVQSSSAEMTKLAESRMFKSGIFEKYDAKYIGPIHDEAVASVSISDLENFLKEMHWCMVQPYGGMEIPIESSISFGRNFGEQIEIGEAPVEAAIAKGLQELADLTKETK